MIMRRTHDDERPRDLTLLCERLAQRMHRAGSPHPLEAAVALTVRGSHKTARDDYAAVLGLSPTHLLNIEEGCVAFVDLPPALLAAARQTEGLDLDRIVSLTAP